MIYMIVDETRTNFYCKIGLTRDISSRQASYRTHSPCATFLCACAGTGKAELEGRDFLSKNGQRVKGSEWFIVSEQFYNECKAKGLSIVPKFQKAKITWYVQH